MNRTPLLVEASNGAALRGGPVRPLKNPWFWKEPRFLRPSDARNAHEKCCGIRLWGSAPNPGRGMIPLHPALCQQPENILFVASCFCQLLCIP